MFAGVTMRQENVLCFEYGLLGNVDRGCDFHMIMALQRAAMSVINAMTNGSQYTEFPRRTSAEAQVFADGGVVMKLPLPDVTLRKTGTSPRHPQSIGRIEIYPVSKDGYLGLAATVTIVSIALHNAYHKYWTLKLVLCAILRACVSKTLRDLHQNFGHISVFYLSAHDGAGAEWVAI